jgi:hypothetical protein
LNFPWLQSAKSGYSAGNIKIPGVLRKADEVANRGIRGPAAPQRRSGKLSWHTSNQERAEVGFRAD